MSKKLDGLVDDVIQIRRDLGAIRMLLEGLVVQQMPVEEEGGLPADFPHARRLITAGVGSLDEIPRTAKQLKELGLGTGQVSDVLSYLSEAR